MEELIAEIRGIQREAERAFSFNAMNFDQRMSAINAWNSLLTPENVEALLGLIEEQKSQIKGMESEIFELQEKVE